MSALVIWLYGFPGSGQEEVADALAERLARRNLTVSVLALDIEEELGGATALQSLSDAALSAPESVAIACSVSPLAEHRGAAQSSIVTRGSSFLDCYLRLPLAEALKNDSSGLYTAALKGERSDTPGINFAFQQPQSPQLVLEAQGRSPEQLAAEAERYLEQELLLPGTAAGSWERMASPFGDVAGDVFVGVLPLSTALVCPELVGEWARAFSAKDKALLLFYAPGWHSQDAIRLLAPLIDEQGMSEPETAALLLLAGRADATVDAEISERADVLLGSDIDPALAAEVSQQADALLGSGPDALALTPQYLTSEELRALQAARGV